MKLEPILDVLFVAALVAMAAYMIVEYQENILSTTPNFINGNDE